MKKAILILTVIALLASLAGCGVEKKLEQVENRIESALERQTPAVISQAAQQETPTTAPLTKEQAEEIALEHVGLTREQAQWIRSNHDFDDGHYEYDIEIHAGEWDYEFEIHAESGKILSYEKEPIRD